MQAPAKGVSFFGGSFPFGFSLAAAQTFAFYRILLGRDRVAFRGIVAPDRTGQPTLDPPLGRLISRAGRSVDVLLPSIGLCKRLRGGDKRRRAS